MNRVHSNAAGYKMANGRLALEDPKTIKIGILYQCLYIYIYLLYLKSVHKYYFCQRRCCFWLLDCFRVQFLLLSVHSIAVGGSYALFCCVIVCVCVSWGPLFLLSKAVI